MQREVPEPWATAMRDAGVVDKRWGNPSWSELARRVGVHTSTLTNMVDGKHRTRVEAIAKVATELRKDPAEISAWIGAGTTVGEPYAPPAESRLLSDAEKSALDVLIKAMAASKTGGVEHGERDSTPTKTGDATVTELPTRSTRTGTSPAKRAARKSTGGRSEKPDPHDSDDSI